MNNGASFNATTINGWRGDVSVRIQVLAYASAGVVVGGRVLRRSVVAGVLLASATAGRIWRRSPMAHQAQADAVVAVTAWRRIFATVAAVAESAAVNLGHVLILTTIRELVAGLAQAMQTSSFGRMFARSVESTQAQADATLALHVHTHAAVSGQAQADAWITLNVDRRIPWDESAPDSRTFIVPAGTHRFYVVS